MAKGKLPAGCPVRYHTGDGLMREGTLIREVEGIGYSIMPLIGPRKLVPSQNVRGLPSAQ